MIRSRILIPVLGAFIFGLVFARPPAAQADGPDPQPNTPIKHFIVLMQENHTFDNYFGTYPGADGIPLDVCMPVHPLDPKNTDCVKPYYSGGQLLIDPDHSSRTFELQYNNGKLDGFVYALNQRNQDGRLAMGYYDDRELPYYWNMADAYVLFDRFFSSAHGGSMINHLYWVTGTPGTDGGQTPPEGFGELRTIFDRLEERGISWKFYVQNYDPTLTYRNPGTGDRSSQVVWVPLLNFARYIDDPKLSSHIVDLNEYYTDLENNTLPAVAYIVPSGASDHPPSSVRSGQKFVRALIQALMRSEAWNSSAFMWAYDDWGGWYDHVPPPQVDKYGYGFRVPALLVSPYAKRGYIDHTQLDFTSMLKFIEENYGLEPLAERDAKANSLVNAFDFSSPPRGPEYITMDRTPEAVRAQPRSGVIYAAYGTGLVLAGLLVGLAVTGARSPRKWLARSKGQKREGDS